MGCKYLYGWAMSQKLPANKFEWIEEISQFHEDFLKDCKGESDEGYFLEVDVQYPETLHELHNELRFLPERKKIKVEKLVIPIRNLKQSLNHGLILKEVHRVTEFNQKYWLKPYIDMNTKLSHDTKEKV